MKQKPLTIHSSKEEIQAFRTSETTEAVNVSRETLSSKLDEVKNAVQNIPETIIPEIPDMTEKFDEIVKAVKSIPKVEIPKAEKFPDFPKIPEFPTKMKVELEGISVMTLKGDKGEIGPIGPKGDSIKGNTGEIGPRGLIGERGADGKKGEVGFSGKDGTNGTNGIDGANGSPDTGEQIIEKLNPLKNSLNFEVLTNIPDFALSKDLPQGGTGGGGPTILFQDEGTTITQNPVTKFNVVGAGASLTYSGSGVATLTISGGSTSPLTTKGDIYTYTSVDARLAVGTDGQALTADSSTATGLKWVTLGAGSGDMVLASAQTNTGTKTFLNTTMKLRNVANTFDGYFVNTNTADRIYTLKDAAGTLAFVTDITGTNSGTNTGDQTITNTSDATSHTVTLSASGGSVQLIEGANITLTTGGTGAAGTVTIASTGGGGGITRTVASIAVDTTAGATAATDYVYFVTATTTLTLPTAVGNTNRYTVKSVSGVTTVACNGAETIDGTATIGIAVQDSVDLISNNVEWKVV